MKKAGFNSLPAFFKQKCRPFRSDILPNSTIQKIILWLGDNTPINVFLI